MKLFALALAWLLWCFVHSALITPSVSEWLRRRLGARRRYQRLLYNLVAIATVLPVLVFTRSLAGPPLFHWAGAWIALRYAILLVAFALFTAGGRHYDMRQFLGLRQIRTGNTHGLLNEGGALDVSGVMAVTRHPWYLGALLFLWTWRASYDAAAVLGSALLSIYLVVGTLLEERKLLAEFGPEYREYQRDVSMLLPLKYLRGLFGGALPRR